MLHRLLTLSFASVLSLLATACTVERDLGQTCKMTRPDPDGGVALALEAERVSNPNLDYISFGAAECDDQVCLRTSRSANPEHEQGTARGYCSAPCIEASDCEPDFTGKKGTMRCEQVLPDLEQMKKDDPQAYEETFGAGASTRYCVLPRQ
jgi:hypothetical protein